MSLFCDYASLQTESDVEQKFIYPLLSSTPPLGLGFDDSQILTKHVLKQVVIGKGPTQKYYYPDYLIAHRGIPVLVLEAKKPSESLETAYAEARLYAEEINAKFPHNINTCQIVIACNGTETWAGYSDSATPSLKLSFEDFCVGNVNYANLLDLCSRTALENLANTPYLNARGKALFFTPVSSLGGKRVQNEELEENSFGRTFIFENRRIFDPETEADRGMIVKNAYISSAKREQHVEPIYKEIRKFERPSEKNTTPLATKEPIGLVQKISQRIEDKNEVYSLFLLVGNVGSGKTTFVRYFQKVFLQKENPQLASQCDWVFINMNQSPVTSDEIYGWIKEEITQQLQENHSDIEFSSLDIITKIFQKDVHNFEIGIGSLLRGNQTEFNKELFNLLQGKLQDRTTYLSALISYLKDQHRLLPIIVLDNCDKRNKDEQLLMFEVAQWLRTTFKCIVLLPMRDTTYDQYKDEPPLDTVVKDLVFRIDPPDLLKVIQARLDYIVRITTQTDTTYVLENGINVSVKKEELIEYFKCIMLAIRGNRMAANIFYRLSDRNTRKGIQLFEDFCKSGHISSNDIFRIRTAGKDQQLPSHKFLNALLRKNRKYYNGENSHFVNLFFSSHSDDFPDPFVRIDILRWLQNHADKEGPSKTKGMFPVGDIMRDMQVIGHNYDVAQREMSYLLKRDLIISESLSSIVCNSDLVKISIPGKLHLGLLNNVTYLAACAEDSNFKNTKIMTSISKRIASVAHLTKASMAMTTHEFIHYLLEYRKEFGSSPQVFLASENQHKLYDLDECINALNKWLENDRFVKEQFDALQKYQPDSKIIVKVVSKNNGALICRFDESQECKGFLSVVDEKYKLLSVHYESIAEEHLLECRILDYDWDHKSFQLEYIRTIETQ